MVHSESVPGCHLVESQEIPEEYLLNYFRSVSLTVVKAEPLGNTPEKSLASQPKSTAPPEQPQQPTRPIATPARAPATTVPVKIESKPKTTKEHTRQDRPETLVQLYITDQYVDRLSKAEVLYGAMLWYVCIYYKVVRFMQFYRPVLVSDKVPETLISIHWSKWGGRDIAIVDLHPISYRRSIHMFLSSLTCSLDLK